VEWQTRTFEGRMPKGMRVQVPPRAIDRFAGCWSSLAPAPVLRFVSFCRI